MLNAEAANGTLDPKELEELRQRAELIRALNGRPSTALASAYKASDIPLEAFENGAAHTRTFGLDVMINDRPARLVLDTGAAGIVISRVAAQRLELSRVADATVRGIGDNSRLTGGYRAIAERFQIGDVTYRNAVISVADQNSLDIVDGLIGTQVMDEFQITLDFAGRKMHLEPIANFRPDGELPDRAVSAQMANATRVFRFGHMLLVPVQVSGVENRLFLLDTGAASTLISYDLANAVSKLSRDDKTALGGLNGRVGNVYQTGSLVLRFAGFEQKNLMMTAFDTWELSHRVGTEISGFLGLPVLELFTLTIDYVNGLVKFERKP